jgi:hypothetical protein
MGFASDQHDPTSLLRLVAFLRSTTPGGAYIFAGAPSHWREGEGDADPDGRFHQLWRAVDCVSTCTARAHSGARAVQARVLTRELIWRVKISPWYVGRFASVEQADEWKNEMKRDVELLNAWDEHDGQVLGRSRGIDYAPVVVSRPPRIVLFVVSRRHSTLPTLLRYDPYPSSQGSPGSTSTRDR